MLGAEDSFLRLGEYFIRLIFNFFSEGLRVGEGNALLIVGESFDGERGEFIPD